MAVYHDVPRNPSQRLRHAMGIAPAETTELAAPIQAKATWFSGLMDNGSHLGLGIIRKLLSSLLFSIPCVHSMVLFIFFKLW